MLNLLVSTTGARQEVPMAMEVITGGLSTVLENLTERGISVPVSPVLTVSESGQHVLSEKPIFG